ncbi:MAG: hypothetical protein ACD_65C00201G0002 [uncultured bacterium]|nr:MAG: hypothetical protein ACD_65C00201G0002 [uncultured bacterium]KKT02436.1 MAG: hypothetical protein UV80_C0003G0022 [Candidatus Peregrinibacteria bacterium GW2011_GWF2_43_17]KKT19335.1 MAG: hypothetical protein UW03_C0020G0040 [Candidatus Peregrinibacteria bacterium GW2011_GWA2_43_8]HAU40158.1 hypothetical protein [Candidatus Peregrinibacteria bacterium]
MSLEADMVEDVDKRDDAEIIMQMFSDFPVSMGRIAILGCGTGQFFRGMSDIGEIFGYSDLILHDADKSLLSAVHGACLDAGYPYLGYVDGNVGEADFGFCDGILMVFEQKEIESALKIGAKNLYLIIHDQSAEVTDELSDFLMERGYSCQKVYEKKSANDKKIVVGMVAERG